MADKFGRVQPGDIARIYDWMAVQEKDDAFIKGHGQLVRVIRPSLPGDVVGGYKMGSRANGDIFFCQVFGTEEMTHVHKTWLRPENVMHQAK